MDGWTDSLRRANAKSPPCGRSFLFCLVDRTLYMLFCSSRCGHQHGQSGQRLVPDPLATPGGSNPLSTTSGVGSGPVETTVARTLCGSLGDLQHRTAAWGTCSIARQPSCREPECPLECWTRRRNPLSTSGPIGTSSRSEGDVYCSRCVRRRGDFLI